MGTFYTNGKNSYYFSLISSLCDSNIFRKDPTVLPFTPNLPQTFVDFVPLTSGTLLDVFLGGQYMLTTAVQPTSDSAVGRITFDLTLPYTRGTDFSLTLNLHNSSTPFKTLGFSTWNLYMFYDALAEIMNQKDLQRQQTLDNGVLATAHDSVLYSNFGILFDLQKRLDQTPDQYRDVLSSFFIAFLNAGTNKGLDVAIEDLTGVTPTITLARNTPSDRVFLNAKYPMCFLTAPITGVVATLPVNDTSQFIPSTGTVYLGSDNFVYAGKTGTSFTGAGVIAGSYQVGTPVWSPITTTQDQLDSHMFLSSFTSLASPISIGTIVGGTITATEIASQATSGSIYIGGDIFTYTGINLGALQYTGVNGTATSLHPIESLIYPVVSEVNLPTVGLTVLPPVAPYSVQEWNNLVYVTMNSSDIKIDVSGEPVFKTGDALSDKLASQYLTAAPLIISNPAGLYLENTNFMVDRTNGKINWIVAQPQPAQGTNYYVDYSFYLIAPIKKVISQLKPSFRKVVLQIIINGEVLLF